MQMTQHREWAHTQALRARGNALPPDGRPQVPILDSWVRCMEAGLQASRRPAMQVVEAADLATRRERWAVARRLAQAELETLAQQIAGSNFLLAFADREGVILDLYADNRFATSGADAGIVAGSCWTEALAGTNGLGTALSLGAPVAVSGLEHYFLDLGAITCTAAPVRDPQGQIIGVLDASSYFESRQHHTLALVQMAATHIENGLLVHQLRPHWILAVHPRVEFLGTLSAGLLAFDGAGQLLAMNARGRHFLAGLEAAPGAAFESLFCEPFEHLLARLARGGDARLRDLLGSTLHARCVNRPVLPVGGAARASAAGVGSRGSRQEAHPGAGAVVDGWANAPRSARARVAALEAGLAAGAPAPRSVVQDPAVVNAYALVARAVSLYAAVPLLIHGETGSGKELLARHAHTTSGRTGAFVAVNCGAMPAELFEAELFGYAPGAYTGARREGHIGLIARADGGTLLLDEVAELPSALQAALLRFLDERQVRAVGAVQAQPVDVLVLAASNADLEQAVAAGRFRADLLHRLNTVRVGLVPLRQRSDFAACARHVLAEIEPTARLDEAAVQRLAAHSWPGNFRELRAVLTRALLAQPEAAALCLTASAVDAVLPHLNGTAGANGALGPAQPGLRPGSQLQRSADELVRQELQRQGGSVSRTARVLGVSRTTVYRHLNGSPPTPSRAPSER
jgi:sigma-54 dependent transcriptional regulator, acetoin dehydrogenase operon transcriptional activator AcoR